MRVSLISIFLFFCTLPGQSQVVTVSPDISIRNTAAYDVIGRIDDRILFYKEKGQERSVLLYDNDLVYQSERQINLDEKKVVIYEVSNLDTAFAITYGYRKDGEDVIKLDLFGQDAVRKDSVVLSRTKKEFRGLEFEAIESQNENILALFALDRKDEIRIITIDIAKTELINDKRYKFEDRNLYSDVIDFQVDDSGFFYMLSEVNNSKNLKGKHSASIHLFSRSAAAVDEIVIPLQDIVCQDLKLFINNKKNLIGLAGLYDEKRTDESTGYFLLKGNRSSLGSSSFDLIPFSDDLFFEMYGRKHKGRMENFTIADVIWKADGSPILVMEVAYDAYRRSGVSDSFTSSLSKAAWSDHYRDDLLLISLDNNGLQKWHQVFYKKQFSQNDDGVFSSFFTFLTPSRLRLVYNDEIKNNSTVSEYILDGAGNYKRSSVLSTEYQDLNLRFADATQISSTELLVPSQTSYTVNLVKIDFTK